MENANPYTDKHNRWSSHYQIARMLADLPPGSRILDVGSASGTLARLCVGKGFLFRGIEPNVQWLGESRDLYLDIYAGRLEQVPDEYLAGHAAVVCGDILEHLVDPELQLARLVQAQTNGCLFIISAPNVANLWIRLNLLFGKFDYGTRGILDKSHLHLYTRKTFIRLINNASLGILELRATAIPLDLVMPFFSQTLFGRGLFALLGSLTAFWPTLFGYQWVVKAYKNT